MFLFLRYNGKAAGPVVKAKGMLMDLTSLCREWELLWGFLLPLQACEGFGKLKEWKAILIDNKVMVAECVCAPTGACSCFWFWFTVCRENNSQQEKLIEENLEKLRLQRRDLILNVIQSAADLTNAISWLPKGFLWSQKLHPSANGLFGMLATLIMLYRNWPSS